jgi:putative pyruvate formate lyase activating enzyme
MKTLFVFMHPGYVNLSASGELQARAEKLKSILEECTLCPRECEVNRLEGEEGFCKSGSTLTVSSAHPHFGEESPLVGTKGSGTIFLAGCNLRCCFCQNYDISHLGVGEPISEKELSSRMLKLQRIGCHNINFVTPTHFIPQLVEGISIAVNDGLNIPIVYNCGGYEKVETLKLLDGIVDIYMPDMKYGRAKEAEKYSKAKNYPEICFKAIKEMHNQVGDLKLNNKGIAYRGLLVRHLVLPGNIAGSEEILKFLAEEISKKTYLNIMDQYHPEFNAWKFKELSRSPSHKEYRETVKLAEKYGLTRGESYRHISKIHELFY